MCSDYRFVIVVVSTSSVVWSQVRWFFLLEYIFCAINYDEQKNHFGYLQCLFFICPMVCNTMGLHNNAMFTIVQFVQWFTLYNSVYCSQVQYIDYKFTGSHN